MTLRPLPVLSLLLLAPLLSAAASQEGVRSGTFVLRILDNEVGRETFEVLPDGWRTEGSFDVFGTQKSDYELTATRGDAGLSIAFRGKQDGKDVAIDAVLDGERFESTVQGAPARTLELAGRRPLAFQNLVWAYFLDIGAELARRSRAGELVANTTLDLVETASARLVPFLVRETSARELAHGGEALELLVFEFTLAGSVDGTLATDAAGTPLVFRVPSQKLVMAVEGYEGILPPAEPRTLVDSGPWRAKLSKPEHDVVVETKVLAKMRDGVELAADVHRPAKEGKYPTVLVRTPYGRAQTMLAYGSYFARRGYAVVCQDVRGRFDSGGVFEPLRRETEDGSDTLDWIAAQPWSDGNVGMIGASYLGFAQWAAAKSGNPHLKAIVPQVAPPDPQYNIPYLGGAFFLSSVWWARVVEDMSVLTGGGEKVDWMAKLATLPLSDLDEAFGIESRFLDEWVAHPPHDPWWEPQSYQAHYGDMDVPALSITGWYDGDQPGAPMNYVGMRAHGETERARRGQQLLIGPWTHLFNSATRIGTLDFGPDAVVGLDAVALRWFDHWLKGIDNGVEREDPVVVFTMGANQWRREEDWPLPQTRWTKLYLAGDGHANRRDGGGTLALAPQAGSPPDHYDYDPARMPDVPIDFDDLSGAQATRDVSKDPDREDVLDFTSPPLRHAVELTGPFKAVLSVTTDAKDTDFVVGIARIFPSGRALELRGGVQRLRYRSGYEREDWAEPGEVSTLEIDLWATGLTLDAGDRLRVEVTSSAFPGTARNPNTGEPDATATRMVVARQTVFHDAERPSYVVLPVIPREGLGEIEFEE